MFSSHRISRDIPHLEHVLVYYDYSLRNQSQCLFVCCIGWFCSVFVPLLHIRSFSQIKDWKLFHIHQIFACIKVKILNDCKCWIIQMARWIAHLRKEIFIISQVPSTNQNASLDGILYVQLPYSWTQHYSGQSVLSICHTWKSHNTQ
jgi:hypothetical protein